jgi:hypothetical protein
VNCIAWFRNLRYLEKIKRSEKVTSEEVLEQIKEKRTLLNNILAWIHSNNP